MKSAGLPFSRAGASVRCLFFLSPHDFPTLEGKVPSRAQLACVEVMVSCTRTRPLIFHDHVQERNPLAPRRMPRSTDRTSHAVAFLNTEEKSPAAKLNVFHRKTAPACEIVHPPSCFGNITNLGPRGNFRHVGNRIPSNWEVHHSYCLGFVPPLCTFNGMGWPVTAETEARPPGHAGIREIHAPKFGAPLFHPR